VQMRKSLIAGLATCSLLSFANGALAHVSVAGPAFAGKSQVLTFGVGHGCEGGTDTFRVEIAIPEEVKSLRALPSAWGEAVLTKNDADSVTAVTWTKSEVRDADDQYYQFAIRITVPDAPFTTLYFPATQTCRNADGEETTVAWAALPGDEPPAEGEEVLESPALLVLPPRMPGWNKYTVEDDIDDLSMFDDAQIVWVGDAAYSANPETAKLIESEDDVDELEKIEAGAEIWVKY